MKLLVVTIGYKLVCSQNLCILLLLKLFITKALQLKFFFPIKISIYIYIYIYLSIKKREKNNQYRSMECLVYEVSI